METKKIVKYKNYYVAYMDIVGFRNITNSLEWEPTEIYSVLKMAGKDVPKPIRRIRIEDIRYENIRSYIMSDSIVYYIDSSTENALITLIYYCSILLGSLLMRDDHPLLCRGAIVKGDLFRDDDILFGPALTNAYELETMLSIYPRIVIDEKISNNLENYLIASGKPYKEIKRIYDKFIYKDYDGIDCIEYTTAYIEYKEDAYNKLMTRLKEIEKATKIIKDNAKWKYILNHHMTRR